MVLPLQFDLHHYRFCRPPQDFELLISFRWWGLHDNGATQATGTTGNNRQQGFVISSWQICLQVLCTPLLPGITSMIHQSAWASNCIHGTSTDRPVGCHALQARVEELPLWGNPIASIASQVPPTCTDEMQRELSKCPSLGPHLCGGPDSSIRAALLVLIQHSTVLVKKSKVTNAKPKRFILNNLYRSSEALLQISSLRRIYQKP
jgi:hypothetical protein